MKIVRPIASILYYLSKTAAIFILVIWMYSFSVVLLHHYSPLSSLPIETSDNRFTIFLPFTKTPFLLGDYTGSFLFTNLFTVLFYGFFLWLLSGVFNAFRQQKLFTSKGVIQLSRFYIINLMMPVLFLLLLIFFRNETGDLIRIMCLHLVIGVFAFFMAAIFKQGLVLQDEQDQTF